MGYVTANSHRLTYILRVLQALNPDATDMRGKWWAKIHFPLFPFLTSRMVARLRVFAHQGGRAVP